MNKLIATIAVVAMTLGIVSSVSAESDTEGPERVTLSDVQVLGKDGTTCRVSDLFWGQTKKNAEDVERGTDIPTFNVIACETVAVDPQKNFEAVSAPGWYAGAYSQGTCAAEDIRSAPWGDGETSTYQDLCLPS